MQKIIVSIIISAGLILSANILANKDRDNDKEVGRYQLFQGNSEEAIFYETNGVVGGDVKEKNMIFKIDTKTGEVSKYEVYINSKDEKHYKNGFYRVWSD